MIVEVNDDAGVGKLARESEGGFVVNLTDLPLNCYGRF
jgi:hypothetical protein